MTREEAIRIIEANCSCTESKLREACAMFIPELRESEDERIRKAIIHLFEVRSEAYLVEATGFKKEQFLAYLEKQKDAFENGRQFGIMQEQARQELELPDEKQKEQKPISFNEPYNPDEYEVVMEGNTTSLKRKELKHVELNEEDDKLRYYIYEAVQTRYSDRELSKYLDPKIIGEKMELRRKIFAFLRNLRPSLKSNEKDKEMKLKILKYLSTRCSVEQFEEVEEWLNDKLK